MTPIYWNLAFTALNTFWIVQLLLERRPVKLSDEEQRLCELVFRTMTPREMIKILKLASWQSAVAGEYFVERGKPLDRLMVIYSGKACVEVGGKNVTCPSSKQMGLLSVFHKGGSGSSLFDVKPLGFDGSSGGFGWSFF